jgi:branched-chain amino acid transport system ATP-binding protein
VSEATDTAATDPTGDRAVLRTDGVTKRFGGLTAVDDVDVEVNEGEIVGLIGPNGAGKSTLFNCITGTLEADEGHVYLQGEDVTDWPEYRIARAGLGRMFQETRIFGAMTVRKNLLLAAQEGGADARSLLRRPDDSLVDRADELLAYVDLDGLADVRAGRLSFGQQKLVEFTMALMADPEVLLMDEPAGGINPSMIGNLIDYIRTANVDEDATIFLIEHNMDFVMEIADRIYVLAHGEKIAEGSPEEIQSNERVHDVDLSIDEGEVACLIGPNGSGKSTVMKSIYGFADVFSGTVRFDGEDVTGRAPKESLRSGMSYVLQDSSVFPRMTVDENMLMGGFVFDDDDRARERIEQLYEEFPQLSDIREQRAGTLSGGQRRLLELARALVVEPEMMLLDEPSIGLEPRYIDDVFERIEQLNEFGTTILLVEQNAEKGLSVADKGFVLASGEIKFTGTGAELLEDEEIGRLYLGG